MRVLVVGATPDRARFANKAVRAYVRQGHTVMAVNPKGEGVEGVPGYASVLDAPGPLERVLIYLRAANSMPVLEQLATRKDIGEVWLNPGADDPEVVALGEKLGLTIVCDCSIVAIGDSPSRY